MLPEFPTFKNLELSDRTDIEAYTKSFPPYSDFNFTSMWSWNFDNQFAIAQLNQNLVVRFTDYVSGQHFVSFIGVSDAQKTAEEILRACAEIELQPAMKLLPHMTAELLKGNGMQVVEDRDNFDYIYSVDELVTFPGSKFSSKRNYVRRFTSNYEAHLNQIDISDKKVQLEIKDLFFLWALQKEEPMSYSEHEFIALSRFIALGNFSDIIALGLYINDKLQAFWFLEKNGDYALSHFSKANVVEYVGVNPYLHQESAKLLSSRNIKYVNDEQDLGIRGLRESKEGYHPIQYLKKYFVSK